MSVRLAGQFELVPELEGEWNSIPAALPGTLNEAGNLAFLGAVVTGCAVPGRRHDYPGTDVAIMHFWVDLSTRSVVRFGTQSPRVDPNFWTRTEWLGWITPASSAPGYALVFSQLPTWLRVLELTLRHEANELGWLMR